MALSIYALATVADFKREARIDEAQTSMDAQIERVIDRASSTIEQFCHRQLVYRGTPYVEYHTIKEFRSYLWLLDYPVFTLDELKEDANRNYASVNALVSDTDFILTTLEGKLTRVSGSSPIWWPEGVRTVKVTYRAGYKKIDGTGSGFSLVPDDLNRVALALAVHMWREIERKQQNIMSVSNATGGSTRFGAGSLYASGWMAQELGPYVREVIMPTGERE